MLLQWKCLLLLRRGSRDCKRVVINAGKTFIPKRQEIEAQANSDQLRLGLFKSSYEECAIAYSYA